MKVVGFITEYNPFHLGHKYHLEKSKEITNSTHSIAVMSGSFVQRGEPSLIDKWTKAKMAIDNGVDLVIELPFIYSVQSAELFAFGGVSILNSLNIIDYIAFGSENHDIAPLIKIAKIFNDEPQEFKIKLKEYLNLGYSYSKSRSSALEAYIKSMDPLDNCQYNQLLKQSNNILGIEYLKALERLSSPIKPILVKRQGNNYNDKEITTPIASATGIRNKLLISNLDSILNTMPSATYNYLESFYREYGAFNYLNNYSQIFQYLFRTLDIDYLKNIMDMENGLENRILEMSKKSLDINQIIEGAVTKRYPSTRIKRILIHMLSDLNHETIRNAYQTPINYIRILGSNKKGLEILNKIKNNSEVSIITKYADYKSLNNNHTNLMLKYEEKATDLYYLGINKDKPKVKMDYLISPYIK